jgi:hypothetical protein
MTRATTTIAVVVAIDRCCLHCSIHSLHKREPLIQQATRANQWQHHHHCKPLAQVNFPMPRPGIAQRVRRYMQVATHTHVAMTRSGQHNTSTNGRWEALWRWRKFGSFSNANRPITLRWDCFSTQNPPPSSLCLLFPSVSPLPPSHNEVRCYPSCIVVSEHRYHNLPTHHRV